MVDAEVQPITQTTSTLQHPSIPKTPMKRPTTTHRDLVHKAIAAFDRLGSSPTARIDARVWADYFRKRVKKVEGK